MVAPSSRRGVLVALALCAVASVLAPSALASRATQQAAALDAAGALGGGAQSETARGPGALADADDKTLGFTLDALENGAEELRALLNASACLSNLTANGGLEVALEKLAAANEAGSKYAALSDDSAASGEFFSLVGDLGLRDKLDALAPAIFALRVCLFEARKKVVDQLNSRTGTKARFKHNIFSLLTGAEKAKSRGATPPAGAAPQKASALLEGSSGARATDAQSAASPASSPTSYPGQYSWVGSAITPSPLNQGQCGGCWAFSAAEVISGVAWIEGGEAGNLGSPAVQLSPQQLISCATQGGNNGCNGGWPANVWMYYTPRTQLVTLSAYPYSSATATAGVSGTCSVPQGSAGSLASKNVYVGPGNGVQGATNDQMVAALLQNPFSIAIYASAPCFENYAGGMLTVDDCNVPSPCPAVDHAIVMVGYSGYPDNLTWLVKNQWGSGWGENGFMNMSAAGMGQGNCQGLLQVNLFGQYPASATGAVSNPPTPPTAPTAPTPFDINTPSGSLVLSAPLLGSLLAIVAALGHAAFF
jgi:hypothetical protein